MNLQGHKSKLIGSLVLLAWYGLGASGKGAFGFVRAGAAGHCAARHADHGGLEFPCAPGFHINSNTPKSEFLIPTNLKMDLPTDIILGRIQYPAGKDLAFPFSPDEKLNVYSGDFTIAVAVHPLHAVVPGKYVMHGVLRYQACDNAQCFPPKTLPVSFDVKVVKEPPGPHHNPAQSPHVHN